MTTVLAFDTATDVVTVAVGRHGDLIAGRTVASGRAHAEHLVPTIRAVLDEASTALEMVDAVAVGVGPGRFTGLRVGVTTAKALALGLGVPAVGLGTLDVIAQPWRDDERDVVVVVDARRKEVYWARYHPGPAGLVCTVAPTVAPPAAVVAALGSDAVLLVGDGLDRYRVEFAALAGGECMPPHYAAPSPLALCELADAAVRSGSVVGPDGLVPVYLRESDAVINWEQARPAVTP
ncbi:MAG: tRNA (adenosine(37)-N6)-threonylcarbamoyltransferase complex dimerization subunit type 1 TsaB [Actinomycetes bacterium]